MSWTIAVDRYSGERHKIVFDIYAWLLIIASILIFIFVEVGAVNRGSLSDAVTGLVGASLLTTGLLLSVVSGRGIKTDSYIDPREYTSIFTAFFAGFAAVAVIMFIRNMFFPMALLTKELTAVLMAISETIFIIGLFEVLSRSSGGRAEYVSMSIASIFWSVNHVFVYGVDFTVIIPVFLIGIILLTVYRITGNRVSVPTLIHLINNVVAISPASTIMLIALASIPIIAYIIYMEVMR